MSVPLYEFPYAEVMHNSKLKHNINENTLDDNMAVKSIYTEEYEYDVENHYIGENDKYSYECYEYNDLSCLLIQTDKFEKDWIKGKTLFVFNDITEVKEYTNNCLDKDDDY